MPRKDPQARKEYSKEYNSRPEVKARNSVTAKERYHKGYKEYKADYDRVRRQDPEYRLQRAEYMRQRKLNNWAKVRIAELRGRARRIGVEFNITEADIPLPEVCPVFGVKLQIGVGKQSNSSPSVDRIDPKVGYVKGNVVVVCNKVNSLKRDATIEELQTIVDFYLNLNRKVSND